MRGSSAHYRGSEKEHLQALGKMVGVARILHDSGKPAPTLANLGVRASPKVDQARPHSRRDFMCWDGASAMSGEAQRLWSDFASAADES